MLLIEKLDDRGTACVDFGDNSSEDGITKVVGFGGGTVDGLVLAVESGDIPVVE